MAGEGKATPRVAAHAEQAEETLFHAAWPLSRHYFLWGGVQHPPWHTMAGRVAQSQVPQDATVHSVSFYCFDIPPRSRKEVPLSATEPIR